MSAAPDFENRAGLARVTCGWKKPHLAMDVVRRYWRDVHSPGISRRPGLWEYRHLQFDPVRGDLFAAAAAAEVATDCPPDQQLHWTSDVRYLDDAALAQFSAEPAPEVKALLLADIDLIVDRSTTYLVLGDAGHTHVDRSGSAAPQGPVRHPVWALFFRQRGTQAAFRAAMRALAARWAAASGVLRLRLALFETPDLEAERQAGYPIKTHAAAQQYQAWIDLMVEHDAAAAPLLQSGDGAEIAALHAYPVPVVYTSICQGRPTLVGLRGWPAHDAIQALGATHQTEPALLQWMYGPVVHGGPLA